MKYHCQILLTTAALGTIACQKDVEPLAAPHTSSRTISFTPHASRPDEAILAEIQAEVPSFGGHFVGPNGNLTAYVTDLKDAPAASAALQRRLGTRIHLPRGVSSSIHVIKGDYTFQQLSDWRDSVFAHVLGKVHGVIYDDLDEGANRVAIAIEAGQESQVEPSVIQILTPLGVPTNAVAFVSKHRMRLATEMRPSSERASRATNTTPQTLGSWSDSLVGGLRVSCMHYSGGQTTFVGGGTVGYTASFSNGTHGFLTVSHCSPTQFQTDGTAGTYYQPYTISNSYVGYEAF